MNEGGIEIQPLDQWQLAGIREKFANHSELPANLADTTLPQVAEMRNLDSIITLDNDFNVYRNKKGKTLMNLLEECG